MGVSIANDAHKVLQDHNVAVKALEDLSELANKKLDDPKKWSLASLTEKLLAKQVFWFLIQPFIFCCFILCLSFPLLRSLIPGGWGGYRWAIRDWFLACSSQFRINRLSFLVDLLSYVKRTSNLQVFKEEIN